MNARPEHGTIMGDDQIEELARLERQAERSRMIDQGARALYAWHIGRVGRTALPAEFAILHRHTREQFEIGALRVLQAAGVLAR